MELSEQVTLTFQAAQGIFQSIFMSALEDLARPGNLVNCAAVMRKLGEEQRKFEDDMKPVLQGNHGMGSIVLTPILG